MPILDREPDLYPDNLLDDDGDDAAWSEWWALYTLSRREKELMRRLRALEVPHYGPIVSRRSKTPGGRATVSHVPLFPGYVFLRGGNDERQAALATNCISRSIPVPDAEALVGDLRRVKRLLDSGLPVESEPHLEPGGVVRIRRGPLLGIEGVVVQRRNETRVVVAVNFLKQGASVVVETSDVEPAP